MIIPFLLELWTPCLCKLEMGTKLLKHIWTYYVYVSSHPNCRNQLLNRYCGIFAVRSQNNKTSPSSSPIRKSTRLIKFLTLLLIAKIMLRRSINSGFLYTMVFLVIHKSFSIRVSWDFLVGRSICFKVS